MGMMGYIMLTSTPSLVSQATNRDAHVRLILTLDVEGGPHETHPACDSYFAWGCRGKLGATEPANYSANHNSCRYPHADATCQPAEYGFGYGWLRSLSRHHHAGHC